MTLGTVGTACVDIPFPAMPLPYLPPACTTGWEVVLWWYCTHVPLGWFCLHPFTSALLRFMYSWHYWAVGAARRGGLLLPHCTCLHQPQFYLATLGTLVCDLLQNTLLLLCLFRHL